LEEDTVKDKSKDLSKEQDKSIPYTEDMFNEIMYNGKR